MNTLVSGFDLLLTMDPTLGEGPLGALHNAGVLLCEGRVDWVGDLSCAPDADSSVDARGCIGMPALVDCHTHSVWAGSRADEWRRRLAGADYSTILEQGGGILSTVQNTRAASQAELTRLCAERLSVMQAKGVGTVEIKSGYGLTPADEAKMLAAARDAGERVGVRVLTTFLGAHTVPAEHRHDRAAYVRQVIEEQLPVAAPLADFVDVYVDRGAFTVEEGRAILSAGKSAGLGVRIHAEQVAFTGSALMAASLGASSADHLERIDAAGISAMAAAGTVAVLLPGAMLYLRDDPPPVAALREASVPMAVATDYNPGTSPVDDLWTCATLGCVTMGLTVEEALRGITAEAAWALGRHDLGVLRPGAVGELILVEGRPGEPAEPGSLLQHLGASRVRWVRG